jgi:hypothetical protein
MGATSSLKDMFSRSSMILEMSLVLTRDVIHPYLVTGSRKYGRFLA